MKRIYTILIAVIVTANVFAQSPEKMSYQAVIRDASRTLVTTQVGMKLSVLKGDNAITATEEYSETLTPTPNINGLVSIEFGGQTGWNAIDWANGTFFIKTEMDVDNDGTYDVEGTSQLLSVPYALHAKTAESITGDINETDPVFDASIASVITETDIANWNNKLEAEVDGSVTNELQTLSVSNDTIYLSNGGFAKIPAQQSKNYAVGDTAFGGIIFYVNNEGTHGLVAAKTDQAYDGSDLSTLVDYNEAPMLCSDKNRFDEQGQQYSDWRLPTVNEMAILNSYYDALSSDDLLEVLHFVKNNDAQYYWCSDVHFIDDVSSYDVKVYTRRYYLTVNSPKLSKGYEDLEYDCNVRCVRSF